MSTEMLVAAIIFIATYALISLRRLPRIEITAWQAALMGGFLMLLIGAVTLDELEEYVDLSIIFLLLGTMLLVASLDACGFFGLTANVLLRWSGNGKTLLAAVMVISAVLSALVLNDAVVLLMAPAVIRCCRKTGATPVPYLIAVFVSANIGSVATVVGNPQNAYIATSAGIDFLTFSQYMIPLSIVCLVISYLLLLALFGKKLNVQFPKPELETPEYDRRLYPVVAIMLAMMVMFALSHTLDIPLWSIALTAGLIAYVIVATMGKEKAWGAVKRVDWGVMLFFIGLFIVMGGAVETGLLDEFTDAFSGLTGEETTIGGLTLITAVLSNLISNVPSVILLDHTRGAGNLGLWLTLAAASTLAGNMTMIGAAANVIVSEEAEKENVRIDFWRFLKIGIPVSVVTLLIAYAYLTVLF